MAKMTGTAANHYDLLLQTKAFALANGWTVLNFTDDLGVATDGRGSILNLQGPGNGSGQNVYVNLSTVVESATTSHSWQISCATSFSNQLAWGLQPSESPPAFFNLWDQAIPFWIYINNRRLVIVVQISTIFVSMHAGFFLPWGTPVQYPAPYFVAGDFYKITNWTTTDTGRRMMVDCGGSYRPDLNTPSKSAGWVRDPNGQWGPVLNSILTGSPNDQSFYQQQPVPAAQIWPWATGGGSASGTGYDGWGNATGSQSFGGAMDYLVPTRQGERFVWPVQLLYCAGPPLGVLDSVYATFGARLSTNTILTIGGRTFRAFQNIARNSGNDFFLVEEV